MGHAGQPLQPERRGRAGPLRRPRVLAAGVVLVVAGLIPMAALWHTDTGPVVDTVTVGKMPGMIEVDASTDRAFVTDSADHTVSVLDARSGAVLRTVALGHEPDTLQVNERTGRVVVLSDTGYSADTLDAATGIRLRTVAVNPFDLAVDDQTGQMLVAGPDGSLAFSTLTMLDGRSGSVLRRYRVDTGIVWTLAVDSRTRRAFVTNTDNGTVAVVDLASGHTLRLASVGAQPVQVAVDTLTGRAFVMNNGGDTVTMLDARSGAVLRTIKVGANPARAAVDERTGRVFVVHGRGTPADPNTGSLSGFAAYTATGVTMLDARSGAVLGSVPVGGSPVDDVGYVDARNLAVDQRRGLVFVINQPAAVVLSGSVLTFVNLHTTGNAHIAVGVGNASYLGYQTAGGAANSAVAGSVSVLDARSGHLLRTLRVGRHPIALAVDEATARLFVVNTNSGCVPHPGFLDQVPSSVRHLLPFLPASPWLTCDMPGSVTVIDTSRL